MQAMGARVDGTAAVKNGQIIVTDPQEGGNPAVIIPGENVQIMVNDELIQAPKEVTSQDRILLIPHHSEPHWQAEVRITSDKMGAYLKINRTPGMRYEVKDTPPASQLVVSGQLVELKKPEITLEQLQEVLQARGVVFGIMPEMLQLALDSEQDDEFFVAKGEPATPGVDASLRILYEEKETAERKEGTPLVHVHEVVSVEPGEVLVEVIPPKPGKNGTDVLGNPVPPPEPKNITLKAGTGAELIGDGTKAVATIAGRPILKGQTIVVVPTYTFTGDVDAKTGIINFKGDVTIQGNVLDGMKVEASGRVTISGYVANATVIAGGDVIIGKNVVGSTVRAGGISTLCQRLLNNLTHLEQNLKILPAAIEQLKRHPLISKNRDFQRLGEVVILKMLMDKKFKKVPEILQEIGQDLERLKGAMEGKDFDDFLKSHENFSQIISGRIAAELTNQPLGNYIKKFLEQARSFALVLKERSTDRAKLVVPYVQNSHLESSGDVIISGKGCYNSNIFAGQNVLVEGSPGVFRGGEIVAGGQVKVRELGCPAEVSTTVVISKGKTINAVRAYPGVTIKAGSRIEKLTSEVSNLFYQGL